MPGVPEYDRRLLAIAPQYPAEGFGDSQDNFTLHAAQPTIASPPPASPLPPEYDRRLLAIAPQYPAEGFGDSQDNFTLHAAQPAIASPPPASPPPPVEATPTSPHHTATLSEEKEFQLSIQHSTTVPWWRRKPWIAASILLLVIAVIAGIVVGVVYGTGTRRSDSHSYGLGPGPAIGTPAQGSGLATSTGSSVSATTSGTGGSPVETSSSVRLPDPTLGESSTSPATSTSHEDITPSIFSDLPSRSAIAPSTPISRPISSSLPFAPESTGIIGS